MISITLRAIETELRQAAAQRAYADVERLAVRVGATAAEEARALPAGDPGIGEIGAWLTKLLEQIEILVRIARASQADEFRRIVSLKKYLPRKPRPAPQVRLAL